MARRLGVLLRRWREAEGLSLREAAQRLGCTDVFLLELERGRKRTGSLDAVGLRIARAVRDLGRAADRMFEDFLWDLMTGRRHPHQQAVVKAAQMALAALRDPTGDLYAVSDALVDAAREGEIAGVELGGDRMRLSGTVTYLYNWPRAVMIDFVLETVDEMLFRFHPVVDPQLGRLDGQLAVRIRPEFAAERAPWIREYSPDLTFASVLDYEPLRDSRSPEEQDGLEP